MDFKKQKFATHLVKEFQDVCFGAESYFMQKVAKLTHDGDFLPNN